MKKPNLLLTILIGLSILSCSSDDDDNPQTQISQLTKIEQRSFYNGTLEEKIIINYSNQKPELWSFYDETNQLTFTSEWNYSTNGNLISIKGYLPDGSLSSESNISYDNSNRIIQTIRSEENNTYITSTNFIHNSDNTITSNTDSNGNISSKIFEINNNGIIDKEIENGNVIVSVQYDNLKPISKTSYSTTYNYTYEENGSIPITFQSLFGANPINVVLFQNSLNDSSDSLTTELITEIASTSSTEEYVYTLNDDNFPATRKDYYNGELDDEFDYFYE